MPTLIHGLTTAELLNEYWAGAGYTHGRVSGIRDDDTGFMATLQVFFTPVDGSCSKGYYFLEYSVQGDINHVDYLLKRFFNLLQPDSLCVVTLHRLSQIRAIDPRFLAQLRNVCEPSIRDMEGVWDV